MSRTRRHSLMKGNWIILLSQNATKGSFHWASPSHLSTRLVDTRSPRSAGSACGLRAIAAPPVPSIDLRPFRAFSTCHQALRPTGWSRLDPAGHTALPHMYIRKEAVLSSQIEGTQSSLSTCSSSGGGGARLPWTMSAKSRTMWQPWIMASRASRKASRCSEAPSRNPRLLSRMGGEGRASGEFRRSQNWVGGTRPGNATFVPPPPQEVQLHGRPRDFLQTPTPDIPILVKAGLAHVQFETIHPFSTQWPPRAAARDVVLCEQGVAWRRPLLYLASISRRTGAPITSSFRPCAKPEIGDALARHFC